MKHEVIKALNRLDELADSNDGGLAVSYQQAEDYNLIYDYIMDDKTDNN